jgi:hypothetical protein
MIDGEVREVEEIHNYGYLTLLQIGKEEYYIAENREAAGEACREYWEDMAENDPKEFACLVGEETLIKWALNQYAGPGSVQVRNLDEWLDLVADYPEEQWAGYDGVEIEGVQFNKNLAEELGFSAGDDVVLYRNN